MAQNFALSYSYKYLTPGFIDVVNITHNDGSAIDNGFAFLMGQHFETLIRVEESTQKQKTLEAALATAELNEPVTDQAEAGTYQFKLNN